jgi:hypothetical protein
MVTPAGRARVCHCSPPEICAYARMLARFAKRSSAAGSRRLHALAFPRSSRRLIIKALALQLRGVAISKPLGCRCIAIVSTYVSQSFNRYA